MSDRKDSIFCCFTLLYVFFHVFAYLAPNQFPHHSSGILLLITHCAELQYSLPAGSTKEGHHEVELGGHLNDRLTPTGPLSIE